MCVCMYIMRGNNRTIMGKGVGGCSGVGGAEKRRGISGGAAAGARSLTFSLIYTSRSRGDAECVERWWPPYSQKKKETKKKKKL